MSLPLKRILVILIAGLVIVPFFIFFLKAKTGTSTIATPVPQKQNPARTANRSTALVYTGETSTTSTVHSPDGKMELVMQETQSGQNSRYVFTVSEIGKSNKINIFDKTIGQGKMELPFNSWSPDDKYIFISETDGSMRQFYVFEANGEVFSDSKKYIDVLPQFESANTGLKLANVTGWDSDTLLHVLTLAETGEKGPSFWFEIPSKALIRLATR